MMTARSADGTRTTVTRKEAQGTAEPASLVLDEPASVRFLPSGLPLALRWRGGLWQVIGEPVSWSGSSTWGETSTTPPDGHGSVVTTRFWRFQVQTGPASPVLEFDMSAGPRREDWRLRRVSHVTGF